MRVISSQKLLPRWSMIISGMVIASTLGIGILFPVVTPAQSSNDTITTQIVALKASEDRWIEINLSTQRLIAWEGNNPVYAVIISTGKKSTPTLPGVFKISRKVPLERMRGADYDVPNVPHTMYYDGGYAIHGAYWHNRFGTPVSHGCINVALDHAEWLYKWASIGTAIIIHD